MKVLPVTFLALTCGIVTAQSPLTQVVSLLDDLTAKIKTESVAAEKAAAEYAEWCKSKITDTGFAIETESASREELEATVAKMAANIETADSKIAELASSVSQDESELAEATGVREKELATFKESEIELIDSIETLNRASLILEREMKKNPAALVQVDTSDANKMIKSIAAIVDAAALSIRDQKKLMALVQSKQNEDADDSELAPPAAAVYTTHSTSIMDVLEDLKAKAEGELSDLRKAEANAKHNFAMLKQSLSDSMDADNKNLAETKAAKAADAESKASAEGDLAQTIKSLESDIKSKATTETTCAQVAEDHAASMKGRAEELAALAEAKKVLSETTAGAAGQTYSLLQFTRKSAGTVFNHDHMRLANVEIVNLLKRLAKQHHSTALSQLASQVATVFRFGAQAGQDPFAKVKSLISGLISKLEEEASAESSEKAFCDEELGKAADKKSELDAELAKLTSKIDIATAKSLKLKEDVKGLSAELAALSSSQAEATKFRQEAHADYLTAKADLELGLSGVRKALTVLRDFYGSAAFMQQPTAPASYSAKTASGTSVVEILEVVETDFAKNLATEEAEESDAAEAYEKATQEYKITTTMKTQDVKYKEKEAASLDKSVAEMSSDKSTVASELSSVLEYDGKLKERCVAGPEKYEDRKARREAEIAGLKEGLQILETETAFMQRGKRGIRRQFLTPF